MGLNTDVTRRKKKISKQSKECEKDYDLSNEENQQHRDNKLLEFCDMLDLLCLNKGCQHQHLMYYLSNGAMTDVPPAVAFCGDKCPICTGEWHKLFTPMQKEAVYEWFDFIRDFLSVKATVDNLFDLLWKK